MKLGRKIFFMKITPYPFFDMGNTMETLFKRNSCTRDCYAAKKSKGFVVILINECGLYVDTFSVNHATIVLRCKNSAKITSPACSPSVFLIKKRVWEWFSEKIFSTRFHVRWCPTAILDPIFRTYSPTISRSWKMILVLLRLKNTISTILNIVA